MFKYNIEHADKSAYITARFIYDMEMENELPLKEMDVERIEQEFADLRFSLLRLAKKYIEKEEAKLWNNTNANAANHLIRHED
jgi:hypothetical protein